MPVRGTFITVEGIDGAGKSSSMTAIEGFLSSRGKEVVTTREPGGTERAEKIRCLLLEDHAEAMTDTAEMLLVFAARAQHLRHCIEPALAAGHWVLCDRFTDSTYAYQGGGRGTDERVIANLEDAVQGGLRPDLTLLFDIDPSQGLQRATADGEPDRIGSESPAFFERVRTAYLERARREPRRCEIIDASQPLPQVEEAVLACLKRRLGL